MKNGINPHSQDTIKSSLMLIFAFIIIILIETLGLDYLKPIFDGAFSAPDHQEEPFILNNQVIRVIDGDTIVVKLDAKEERVRLLGINTPEMDDDRPAVKCLAQKATDKAKELVEGRQVSLQSDDSQSNRDRYDRLLRYVYLENNTNVNLELIKLGYAYEYTYDAPYLFQDEFKQAQINAQEQKLGLWGELCN